VVPVFSAILVLFSAAGILLETAYRNNARVEAELCRFRVCDTARVIARGRASRIEPGPEAAARGWESTREALRRDPGFAYRWCDAGEALLSLGEREKAAYAFRRAVVLAPHSPPVLIQAAGFAWRTGRPGNALELSRHVLELVREYDPVVFFFYDRSGFSTAELLRSGIPAGAEPARAFFAHTLSLPDPEPARVAWHWLGNRGYASPALAVRYSDRLLARRQYPEAAALVGNDFNGGFEREFSGARLDWSFSKTPGVAEARDSETAHLGKWSLRVSFDGTSNLDYRGVSETLVVAPGTWRLRAWIKADHITTDRGVFLRIFDPEAGRVEARTAAVTGTTEWTPLEVQFAVPAGAGLVQVQLRREPTWKFDNKLAGTVWLDDVELAPAR